MQKPITPRTLRSRLSSLDRILAFMAIMLAWYTTSEGKAQRLAEAAPEAQQRKP